MLSIYYQNSILGILLNTFIIGEKRYFIIEINELSCDELYNEGKFSESKTYSHSKSVKSMQSRLTSKTSKTSTSILKTKTSKTLKNISEE